MVGPVQGTGTEGCMPSKSEKEIILVPGGNGATPDEAEDLLPALDDMTPREIVAELDKYIVGQNAAKRAVAVALRNRVRRQKLPPEIAEDILPKNILMIGPTGVGKTEIARRLARLAGCPFVKVEASKYTEVGYVGRDVEEMDVNFKEMSSGMFGQQKKKRKMNVADAFEYLIQEEESKLLDMDQVTRIAVERAEQMGIIFIDEIDKVAGRESGHGPDVSREGVQRDILPIIEGTTVNTRYGMIRTDHILFIAAGAFHVTKPSDLIPELQGRLPIRVELQSLKEEDFIRILTEPKNALIKQYVALLETEGVKLNITEDAVAAVARFATNVNEQTENIGARRLHTILEKVLDEISFEAPDLKKKNVKVDAAYVSKQLADIVKNQDLSRYIL